MADTGRLAPYRALAGSRLRSQTAYRTSFALDVLGSVFTAACDLGEIYVVFHNVTVLGGLDLRAALLVFGLAHMGFGIANGIAGSLDTMPDYIRTGTFDVMLLRPQPVLAQVVTGDFSLRRVGGMVVGLVAAAGVIPGAGIAWTPARVALLVVTPLAAALAFAAFFLAAGAVQFWLVDASEVTNGFTYGSSYAAMYPSTILPLPVRLFFAFVVPAAFTAYLPAVVLLGLPGARLLPSWIGWTSPVVAALAWLAALGLWRLGIRHYTGAGG